MNNGWQPQLGRDVREFIQIYLSMVFVDIFHRERGGRLMLWHGVRGCIYSIYFSTFSHTVSEGTVKAMGLMLETIAQMSTPCLC